MRLSCNGCRVLRKRCSEDCTIRSCLQWIKTAEGQANATIFLAKFYGRAGLLNLINSGPNQQHSAIFRSLLYEACGRIVNPIYGSVGLLWNGTWHLCQAAVEAVLNGKPIAQMPSNSLATASTFVPLLKSCDIRHVPKESRSFHKSTALHKVIGKRRRYKRSASAAKLCWTGAFPMHCERAPSHESANHAQRLTVDKEGDGRENESVLSVETVEASHVSQTEPAGEVELNLTLGL